MYTVAPVYSTQKMAFSNFNLQRQKDEITKRCFNSVFWRSICDICDGVYPQQPFTFFTGKRKEMDDNAIQI